MPPPTRHDGARPRTVLAGSIARLAAPALAVLVLLGLVALWPGVEPEAATLLGARGTRILGHAFRLATWLAVGVLVIRLLDIALWHGLLARGGRQAPPRLLIDLVAGLVWLAVATTIAVSIFELPVAGVLTTSGVAVAVIGFALRDMLASLFAGIALNIEEPYEIGDWIELDGWPQAKVFEIGWLTTRAETRDGVCVVIPNARLATQPFRNLTKPGTSYRDKIELVLDHALDPARIERIMLAAAAEALGRALGPAPDVKIGEFTSRGISWQLRFWLPDPAQQQEARYRLQRVLLRHLDQAGITLPYTISDVHPSDHLPRRLLAPEADLAELLGRAMLFQQLAPEERRELAAHAKLRRFDPEVAVVHAGEAGAAIYVIIEGVVEVLEKPSGPPASPIPRLGPGESFGEYALLTGEPRTATVRAVTPLLLAELTKADLEPVLLRCPWLAEGLARMLEDRRKRQEAAAIRTRRPLDEPRERAHLVDRIRAVFGL